MRYCMLTFQTWGINLKINSGQKTSHKDMFHRLMFE